MCLRFLNGPLGWRNFHTWNSAHLEILYSYLIINIQWVCIMKNDFIKNKSLTMNAWRHFPIKWEQIKLGKMYTLKIDNVKSFSISEALILASTNPKYDKTLFIELVSSVHENCKFSTCCVHNFVCVWFLFSH